MYLMIIQNKKIKGINIDGCEHKITQFADYTTLILNGTKQTKQICEAKLYKQFETSHKIEKRRLLQNPN